MGMPRRPRIVLPDVPTHVVQRGNDRCDCFRGRFDYQQYKWMLQDAAHRSRCAIHAYVLMTNHVHLLVTPATPTSVAALMQSVGRSFVRYFNDRHRRTGTLWEGRYWSTVIGDPGQFFACSRYIELNPVRARLVEHPREYEWSSFRANGAGARDRLLTPHPLYTSLGPSESERTARYAELFSQALDADALKTIRGTGMRRLRPTVH